MPILRERIEWSRPRKVRAPDLLPEEQAHVKAAIRFLRLRHGSWPKLETATGVKANTLQWATRKRTSVTAGIALRVARAAGAPIDDVLRGAWPPVGACPRCGHVTEGGAS
jgi:hypothetical protein